MTVQDKNQIRVQHKNQKNSVRRYTALCAAFVLVLCTLLFAAACAGKKNIVGYYVPEPGFSNTVMYFAPDGMIYENGAEESVSHYQVSGDTIRLYVDGQENVAFEFDLKVADGGIYIGDAFYRRLEDPEEVRERRDEDGASADAADEGGAEHDGKSGGAGAGA